MLNLFVKRGHDIAVPPVNSISPFRKMRMISVAIFCAVFMQTTMSTAFAQSTGGLGEPRYYAIDEAPPERPDATQLSQPEEKRILTKVSNEGSHIRRSFSGRYYVTLSMGRGVPFRVRYMEKPYRVVVEFEKADFSALSPEFGENIRHVESVRFGDSSQFSSRFVITFEDPVIVDSALYETAEDSGATEFQLAMSPATDEEFMARFEAAPFRNAEGIEKNEIERIKKVEVDGDPTLPLIVLDPGHGGIDPGAVREGLTEKSVTLLTALDIAEELIKSGKYRVALTRDSDRFVDLGLRRKFGEQLGADLFISIHADTVEEGDARGTTVYTLSETASNQVAADFALFENRADVFAGLDFVGREDDVTAVLIDMAQTSSIEAANRIGKDLQDVLRKMNKNPLNSRKESAGFAVLKAPEVPSLLLEIGYLSNELDRRSMVDQEWRKKLAKQIYFGLNREFYPTDP